MTKLEIIAKLWSSIYDLLFLLKGTPTKTIEQIEIDLDILEFECRKYADDIEEMEGSEKNED